MTGLNDFLSSDDRENICTYNNRIAIFTRAKSIRKDGGIGNFIIGITRIVPKTTLIDIHVLYRTSYSKISDFFENLKIIRPNVNLILYKSELKPHKSHHFNPENIKYLDVHEFSDIITNSCNRFLYDCVILNNPETALAASVYTSDILNNIMYFITHELVFNDEYGWYLSKDFIECFTKYIPNLTGINTITQLEYNVESLSNKDKIHVLPLPLPEIELLNEYSEIEKDGVLFIGTPAKHKNPDVFLDIVKQTGLKAKILTGGVGYENKWADLFKKYNITNYELKSVNGIEKVKFIKSAKIAFLPSSAESFSIATLEAMTSCPVILLKKHKWTRSWNKYNSVILSDNPVYDILNCNISHKDCLNESIKLNEYTTSKWNDIFNPPKNTNIKSIPSWMMDFNGDTLNEMKIKRGNTDYLFSEILKIRNLSKKVEHTHEESKIYTRND